MKKNLARKTRRMYELECAAGLIFHMQGFFPVYSARYPRRNDYALGIE